jgi:DNA (cytosine-5)-methyltransferase 1
MDKTVVELFAGVGGFRVGLNEIESIDKSGRAIEKNNFNFVWANQWEPSTKIQSAFDCYTKRFGESEKHVNKDIATINALDISNHSLLVGGFPCQDYSVARTKSGEKGIQGKKGVLWWEIFRILEAKKPPFVLLENVDRLLKSPAKQRGRDFGVMLKTLSDLNYGVEWRVINAAEYGHPQRRRRVFIFAFHNSTKYYKNIINSEHQEILNNIGLFAQQFPIEDLEKIKSESIFSGYKNLVNVSDKFKFNFETSGILLENLLTTANYRARVSNEFQLRKLLLKEVTDIKYYLTEKQEEKFYFLKNSKKIPRKRPDGSDYFYSEGKMSFPDNLDSPGRTMLTSEGSINRSTHVVEDLTTKKLRILTPIECERLNQFPDNWTDTGMTDSKRYFMMGNALVCGVIKKIGKPLSQIIEKE